MGTTKNKIKHSIDISIHNEDVFANYGYDDKEFIDYELMDTVYNLSNAYPLRHCLSIKFINESDKTIDEKRFKSAYKNTLKTEINKKKNEMKRCITTGLIMFVIGLILLLTYVYISPKWGPFIEEVFDLVAWVFAWAAVEILTVELIQILIEIKKYKRILNSKFNFIERNKTQK